MSDPATRERVGEQRWLRVASVSSYSPGRNPKSLQQWRQPCSRGCQRGGPLCLFPSIRCGRHHSRVRTDHRPELAGWR